MGGVRRELPAWGLLATLLAALIAASPAEAAGGPYHPRAEHVGVVVTNDEVLMSWGHVAGAGKVTVRRGTGFCPHTPADGDPAGEVTPRRALDRTVKAGASYCYTLFTVGA